MIIEKGDKITPVGAYLSDIETIFGANLIGNWDATVKPSVSDSNGYTPVSPLYSDPAFVWSTTDNLNMFENITGPSDPMYIPNTKHNKYKSNAALAFNSGSEDTIFQSQASTAGVTSYTVGFVASLNINDPLMFVPRSYSLMSNGDSWTPAFSEWELFVGLEAGVPALKFTRRNTTTVAVNFPYHYQDDKHYFVIVCHGATGYNVYMNGQFVTGQVTSAVSVPNFYLKLNSNPDNDRVGNSIYHEIFLTNHEITPTQLTDSYKYLKHKWETY